MNDRELAFDRQDIHLCHSAGLERNLVPSRASLSSQYSESYHHGRCA